MLSYALLITIQNFEKIKFYDFNACQMNQIVLQ